MDSLEVGYEFPPVSYELMSSVVSKYEEAVEFRLPVADSVPPLAVAARAMEAMSRYFPFPPGSIHANQELEFFKPVEVGSCLHCQSRVIQKISRKNLNMIVIAFDASDQDEELVISGKMTLILPD